MKMAIACLAGLLALQTTAIAQTTPETPAPADTIRLSDEQRDLILNHNTTDSAAAARGEMSGSRREAAQIHGEVGVMVGTNGTRGIFGRADIPLGENGGATIMFENSRYGYRR